MEGRKMNTKFVFLLQFLLFLSLVLCESDDQAAPMEKTEQQALYLMIQGFVGRSWNGSGLYPDPCGWTPIQGVSCDFLNGSWYVTSVSIGPILENSLQCSHNAIFTPHLFELKHLKTLSFFNCFSSPTMLPSNSWNNLSQTLETLEFRSNEGLIGEIPPVIGQLMNLQSLVLVDNSISGKIPQELGNLVHLKRLSLSGNRLSGPVPTSLGKNLANLLILDLSRNSLSGPLYQSLGGLTSLLKLDISNNLLNGSLPKELGDMKSLTLLDLRNNNLSGGLIQSLEQMISLEDMLLSNNPIGASLNEFGWEKLVNLNNLDLSNTSLNGEVPNSIEGLGRLRFIALDNNKLSGSISPRLGDLPRLNALYLNGNNLSGEIWFSEEFYERLGSRFASWGNPGLCYKGGVGPAGVRICKDNEQAKYFDSKNNVIRDDIEQSSSQAEILASCACGALVQLMVVISVTLL
ncbi:uncharacterized protein A4U43_C05F25990 [Asparagus officinalis]|uniref:Leucine-rich repeat-containing N-terminal plant-type domain-containing protein n=1 Tax=Asparagus officinalis TaxID=4686 RepID=A0A5P1EX24_ASPOF|nr:piriformospora indica-insensitive protein 2-like [Asparagus officinalis]ONK69717.1 uncharacterized protein A4U43_C05F25990 [Asparagus officinalis]